MADDRPKLTDRQLAGIIKNLNRDPSHKFFSEDFKNLGDDKKKKFVIDLINHVQDLRRGDFFDELDKLTSYGKGLQQDFVKYQTDLSNMYFRKLREKWYTCRALSPDGYRVEQARREEMNAIVVQFQKTNVLGKMSASSGRNPPKKFFEDLKNGCAYDSLIALQGPAVYQKYRTKTAKLDAAAKALFNENKSKCGYTDTALLCVDHRTIQSFKFVTSYKIFAFQSEMYIGAMSHLDEVKKMTGKKHGSDLGDHRTPAYPSKFDHRTYWGDASGRKARGVFLLMLEKFLFNSMESTWKQVQKEYKDAGLEFKIHDGRHTGAHLMELYDGDLAAEMVGILWRIFSLQELNLDANDMPELPKFDAYTKVDGSSGEGPYTFSNEFNTEHKDCKELGRSYVQRLLYTCKKHHWFLNMAAAPTVACILEKVAAQEDFLGRDFFQNTSSDDSDIVCDPLQATGTTLEEEGERANWEALVQAHRDFAFQLDRGSSQYLQAWVDFQGGREEATDGLTAHEYLDKALGDVGFVGFWKMYENIIQPRLTKRNVAIVCCFIIVVGGSVYIWNYPLPSIWESLKLLKRAIDAKHNAQVKALRRFGKEAVRIGFGDTAATVVERGTEMFDFVDNTLIQLGGVQRRAGSKLLKVVWDGSAFVATTASGKAYHLLFGGATLDRSNYRPKEYRNLGLAAQADDIERALGITGRRTQASVSSNFNEQSTHAEAVDAYAIGEPFDQPLRSDNPVTVGDFQAALFKSHVFSTSYDEENEVNAVGSAAKRFATLSAVGFGIDSPGEDSNGFDKDNWPRQVQQLLDSQPEEWSKYNEEKLLLLFPNKMRKATFAPIKYEPPETRASTKRQDETPSPPEREPRRQKTKASYGLVLDIVAPLSCDLAGLRL